MLRKLLTIPLAIGLTVSCGKNDSTSQSSPTQETVSMKFFDSLVSGLKYTTQSGSEGLTNSGSLNCIPGELVEFHIGTFQLGSGVTCANKTVLPTDLFPSSSISSTEVINTGVLLQSLDDDGDPANGIQIPSVVSNFHYASIDLSDAIDSNANNIPDVTEGFLQEVRNDSGVSITNKTVTNVSAHFQISFGSNGNISKSFTNTTEAAGVGTCPTDFKVIIKNDSLDFEITSGSFPLDLSLFNLITTSRNLANNDFDIIYDSSNPTLDSGACAGNGGFVKSTLTIDGRAYYNSGVPNTDGSYSYIETCVDSTTINLCIGNWSQ